MTKVDELRLEGHTRAAACADAATLYARQREFLARQKSGDMVYTLLLRSGPNESVAKVPVQRP